jgi:hypothetical protein
MDTKYRNKSRQDPLCPTKYSFQLTGVAVRRRPFDMGPGWQTNSWESKFDPASSPDRQVERRKRPKRWVADGR